MAFGKNSVFKNCAETAITQYDLSIDQVEYKYYFIAE